MLDFDVYGDREALIRTESGQMRPRKIFRPSRLLEHDTVEEVFGIALALADLTVGGKRNLFEILDQYEDRMKALYNARVGGTRGGKTLENADRTKKVVVSICDYRRADGAIIAAQSLVNEVLNDMMGQLDPWIRDLLNGLFVRDERSGTVSVERLQSARQVEIPHPKWDEAKAAIADSIKVVSSRPQIRFYLAAQPGAYKTCVEMNFSRIEV